MTVTVEDLREAIAPNLFDPETAASVTFAYKAMDHFGEYYILNSVFGRLTSVTFTLDTNQGAKGPDYIGQVVKDAIQRLNVLVDAGIFADAKNPAEFPDVDRVDITLSIDTAI